MHVYLHLAFPFYFLLFSLYHGERKKQSDLGSGVAVGLQSFCMNTATSSFVAVDVIDRAAAVGWTCSDVLLVFFRGIISCR